MGSKHSQASLQSFLGLLAIFNIFRVFNIHLQEKFWECQKVTFLGPKKYRVFCLKIGTNMRMGRSRALRTRETGPRTRLEQLEGMSFSISCRT